MDFLYVLWAAMLLDLVLGDPRRLPHPVRLMGRLAQGLETLTRPRLGSARVAGCLTVLLLFTIVAGLSMGTLFLFSRLSGPLFIGSSVLLLYTTIAARDLVAHSRRVYQGLAGDINEARRAVAMIVGRDTEQLDREGIVRACVESVAENMSDGIVAPLFWATAGAMVGLAAGGPWPVILGVSFALLYKGINTMDSMFGYRNEQYRHFGTCPARLDDAVNFAPARLSGLALVLAAPFFRTNPGGSRRILVRDHGKHTSPNAGWPEAAMAGALGLQLGGTSSYFGKKTSKPLIGDGENSPQAAHILQANQLVLTASALSLLLLTLSYSAILALILHP